MKRVALILVLSVASVAGCGSPPPLTSLQAATDSLWYARSRILDATGNGVPDTIWLRAYGTRSDSLVVVFSIHAGADEIFREEWHSDYMLIDPPFSQPAPQATVDPYIVAGLERTLASVDLDPIEELSWSDAWVPGSIDCLADPRDCFSTVFRERAAGIDWSRVPDDSVTAVWQRLDRAPFDTAEVQAIAADMRSHTPRYLTFAYGYETVTSIAWSNRTRRFFIVSSCC